MKNFLNRFIILSLLIATNRVHANATGIGMISVSTGAKQNILFPKLEGDNRPNDQMINDASTKKEYEALYQSQAIDASFVNVWNVWDWFGVGFIASAGTCFDNVEDNKASMINYKVKVSEPFNGKLGLTLRYFHTLLSVGARFGYRQLKLNKDSIGNHGSQSGQQPTEESINMEDNWATGGFINLTLLIPLPDKSWKALLFVEGYGDFKSASSCTLNHPTRGAFKLDNAQYGGKIGIGLAYCMYGRI